MLLSICIAIQTSWNRWAPLPDVASSRISPGTIFERAYCTHTKQRCEWRVDVTVVPRLRDDRRASALAERRYNRTCENSSPAAEANRRLDFDHSRGRRFA